jgi:hypothetical protein
MSDLFTNIVPRTRTALGIWIIGLCCVFAVAAALMLNNIGRLSGEQKRREAQARLEQTARKIDEDWKNGKGAFSNTTLPLNYDRVSPQEPK